MASLVGTAHYNTRVSEEISMFHAWSTGNDRACRFGCREIKVSSAPIFLTQFTDMLFCYCYKCFFNIGLLINHYIVCE